MPDAKEAGGVKPGAGSASGQIDALPPDESLITAEQDPHKLHAKEIADSIVNIFRWAIWGILLGGFVVICIYATGIVLARNMEPMREFMKETVIPFLQAAGTFATTVFGSLLAFILGYYFGEKKTPKS